MQIGKWLLAIAGSLAPGLAMAQTVPAGAVYNFPPIAPAIAKTFPLQLDSSGNLKVTGGSGTSVIGPTAQLQYGIGPTPLAAAAACSVLKATAANVYDVSGNVSAAAWVMLFDSPTAPADGAVTPIWSGQVNAGAWSVSYGIIPAAFLTGATVCVSSTGPYTKTAIAAGSNFITGRVQ